jgi:hypothetical protein
MKEYTYTINRGERTVTFTIDRDSTEIVITDEGLRVILEELDI